MLPLIADFFSVVHCSKLDVAFLIGMAEIVEVTKHLLYLLRIISLR